MGRKRFLNDSENAEAGSAYSTGNEPGPSTGERKKYRFYHAVDGTNENVKLDDPESRKKFRDEFEAKYGYMKTEENVDSGAGYGHSEGELDSRSRHERNEDNVGPRRTFPKKFRLYEDRRPRDSGFRDHRSEKAPSAAWQSGRRGVGDEAFGVDEQGDWESETVELFPTELVSYLRGMSAGLAEVEDEDAAAMRSKCLEECAGKEILLLNFESSCRVVEDVFAGSRPAAIKFFEMFLQLPKERLKKLLLIACSCRTLETLLFALYNSVDYKVVEGLWKAVVDDWHELAADLNASHFLRSLMRLVVGLPKKATSNESAIPAEQSLWKKAAKSFLGNPQLKSCFRYVADTALNFASVKDKINLEPVSLVLQEVVEYDWMVRNGKRIDFVMESMKDPKAVVSQWRNKFGSRFWEVLVQRIDEDTRQMLYQSVLEGHLAELSLHQFANFVVDKFVGASTSEELVTDILDEILDALPQLCDTGRWSVVRGLVDACSNYEAMQKGLIKRLRRCFFCTKKSEQTLFIPKVFTMSVAKVEVAEGGKVSFDVKYGDVNGSLLLQELFKLKRNRTVTASLLSLSEKTLFELAMDPKGTHVVQAFLLSPYVSHEDKEAVANIFKPKWAELMGHHIGSHVLDALWDSEAFLIPTKRSIMSSLCSGPPQGKSIWRLMMKKLNVTGFKENRKKWVKDEEVRLKNLQKK